MVVFPIVEAEVTQGEGVGMEIGSGEEMKSTVQEEVEATLFPATLLVKS